MAYIEDIKEIAKSLIDGDFDCIESTSQFTIISPSINGAWTSNQKHANLTYTKFTTFLHTCS